MFKTLRRYKKPIFSVAGILIILCYIGTKTPAVRDPTAKFLDAQSAKLAKKISPENAEVIHELLIHPGDWFGMGWELVMQASWNPWKKNGEGFGEHYEKLKKSKDPADQQKLAEIHKFADEWFQRILERHPDMAVTYKDVPAEQNGFLKLLDLLDRFSGQEDPYKIPQELSDYFNNPERWNAEAAKAYLEKNRALVDEIRSIGLLGEQSVKGVEPHRLGFFNVSLARESSSILGMEARLAAERGDQAAALQSMLAVQGWANHFDQIETPSLLHATVGILFRQKAQEALFSQILPALPAGSRDIAAWEKAMNFTPQPPAYMGKLMKGEWHVSAQALALPIFSTPEHRDMLPDPDAFIDAATSSSRQRSEAFQSLDMKDLALTAPSISPATTGLSWKSRQLLRAMNIGTDAWGKGSARAQHQTAIGQAAFAILKGQPVPNDPVYGLPYRWDPVTRQLSAPSNATFDDMKIKPITLPK